MMNERIKKILNDSDFRNHCKRCRANNAKFDSLVKISEKLARIDCGFINEDFSNWYGNFFSDEEINENVLEFYSWLDNYLDNIFNYRNKVENNFQFLISRDELINNNRNASRGFCAIYRDSGIKEIYINKDENNIAVINNACHKMCHSLSKHFISFESFKEESMGEVCPVIVDGLASEYLASKYTNLKDNFDALVVKRTVDLIYKAKETLLDALIIKVMLGEITYDDVLIKYGDIFPEEMVMRCIQNIENYRFTNMYESRYLLPQMIALKLTDKYKESPKDAIKMFTYILENDTKLTINDVIKLIGFEKEEDLCDSYISNFHKRIDRISNKNCSM